MKEEMTAKILTEFKLPHSTDTEVATSITTLNTKLQDAITKIKATSGEFATDATFGDGVTVQSIIDS